jgi:hypothetical protein
MTGSKTMSPNNPNPHYRRSKKRSGRSGKKRSVIYNIFKWAKKNPIKIIAILFGIILIYITILFIQYANKQKPNDPGSLKVESK